MVEGFLKVGVLVFCFDIKGDFFGLVVVGKLKDFLEKCVKDVGIDDSYIYEVMLSVFWDLFGE